MKEVPGRVADLPDPMVRLAPAPEGRVGHGAKKSRRLGRERACLLAQPLHRAQQLAIDVELALVPGAVPDPHRTAVTPAAEVRQLALRQVALSAHPEHDLEVPLVPELPER